MLHPYHTDGRKIESPLAQMFHKLDCKVNDIELSIHIFYMSPRKYASAHGGRSVSMRAVLVAWVLVNIRAHIFASMSKKVPACAQLRRFLHMRAGTRATLLHIYGHISASKGLKFSSCMRVLVSVIWYQVEAVWTFPYSHGVSNMVTYSRTYTADWKYVQGSTLGLAHMEKYLRAYSNIYTNVSRPARMYKDLRACAGIISYAQRSARICMDLHACTGAFQHAHKPGVWCMTVWFWT